jgi:cold shock CspA family protein
MVMLPFLACLSAAQLFQFQPASLRPAPGQFVMTGSAAAPLAAESFASPPRLVVRPSAEKASFPWALCAAVSTAAFAAHAGSRSRRVPRSDALEAARSRHRRAPCMQMSSGGTVTYFSLQKGFGFIQPQDDGEELYFHVTGIVDDKVPQLGDICYFDTQYDERKGNYRAVNVAGGSGDVLYGINYTTRNEQIMAAATDERRFLGLLDIFSKNAVKLNIVNVATILFQGGKLRLGLPGHLVMYLEATLNAAQCSDSFKAREVGNALYGLQCMDDSEEVRLLLATLTPKVQQCTEELSAQNVGNALYGLQSMSDSTELRQLVAALTRRVYSAGKN